MERKYLHTEDIHNLESPKEIVPEIVKLLNPTSVVDIGCGLGTFLYCFKQEGVKEVLGIDGPWADKSMLYKHLSQDEFLEKDLEKEFHLDKEFDLVVSLEVAEHISAESADTFVSNLVSSGKIILFSAAIPYQGGQNHINEQWLTYWEVKFAKHDYIIHDVLRPLFWDNPRIFWWYKQNMVLITPKEFTFNETLEYNPLRNVVHYEFHTEKTKLLNDLVYGRSSKRTYIKYFIKSIIGSNNSQKIKLKLSELFRSFS